MIASYTQKKIEGLLIPLPAGNFTPHPHHHTGNFFGEHSFRWKKTKTKTTHHIPAPYVGYLNKPTVQKCYEL